MQIKLTRLLSGPLFMFMLFSGLIRVWCGDSIHPPARDNPIDFHMDYSRFRYSDSLTYLEYSIDLPLDQLQFVESDSGGYRAEYRIITKIMQQDSLIQEKNWKNEERCHSLDEITSAKRLYHRNYFLLAKGGYRFRLEIEDVHSGSRGTRETVLSIDSFQDGDLRVSDIQLASDIQRDSSKSIYNKNGYLVVPNPSSLYGVGLPVLLGYSEIYHLAPAESETGKQFRAEYKIYNSEGDVVHAQTQDKDKPGSSAVNITQLNVVNQVSGVYTLDMKIIDLETRATVSIQKKFRVYRAADYEPGGALTRESRQPESDIDNEIDGMSEDELVKEFGCARYIATSEERKTFEQANLEGKREFLKEFWRKRTRAQRDLPPGQSYRDHYLACVETANRRFHGTFRDGWKTDRGRVMLLYGKPDEIERMTFGINTKNHEIWHYYTLQGGVIFIFADKRDMGDMEMVHSTAQGELYDPNWRRWLN